MGAARVSTRELPSQPNVTLREPGLQQRVGPAPAAIPWSDYRHQERGSRSPHAHVLRKGALLWLAAAASLTPVSKQGVEIVENGLEPSPKPKRFTCLLLTFASALRGPDFFQLSGNAGKSGVSPTG